MPPTHDSVWWSWGNSTYCFNPHWSFYSDGSTTHRVTSFKKLRDLPKNRTLVCDMIYDIGSLSHLRNGKAAINMAFKDGHVDSVTDPTM